MRNRTNIESVRDFIISAQPTHSSEKTSTMSSVSFCLLWLLMLIGSESIDANQRGFLADGEEIASDLRQGLSSSVPSRNFYIMPRILSRIARSSEFDPCNQKRLCLLHSHAGHDLFSSFQLYFVNKENAKGWDHQTHQASDCDRIYSSCGDARPPARRPISTPAPTPRPPPIIHRQGPSNFRNEYNDYYEY